MATRRGELAADRLDRRRRPLGVDVRQHDGHLEPAEEERRELGRHEPRADDSDAPDPPGLGLGQPREAAEPPLDDVERVDRRLRLVAREELRERVLLGGVALLEAPARRALDQLERPVGRGRLAVDRVVDPRACLAHDVRDVGEVGVGPGGGTGLDRPDEELERLVDELDGLEHVVDEAEGERLVGAREAVLAERVVDDQLDRGLGSDEPGQELGAAPGGEEPEEDLREAEVAHVRRERPHVAVERQLEPASEGRAVDRGERRERERADAAEEGMPGLTALTGALGRDARELRDVRARGEDEGLAGDEQPAPAAALELVEHLRERPERVGPERVRLAPVRAVVDRHQGDTAGARLGRLEVEAGDGVAASHGAGSPRGAPRPSRARCRARSARSGRRAAAPSRTRAAPRAGRPSPRAGGRRRSRRRRG